MRHSDKKNPKNSSRSLIISLSSFCIIFSLGTLFSLKLSNDAKKMEDTRTSAVAATFAASLEAVLDRTLTATRSLAVMVYQGKGRVDNFSELSQYLLPMYKGAYALSLAPEGVIRQIEPLDRNILVQDHDLFDGKDKSEVIRSLKDNEISFFGPFPLIQGPIGAIGMLPIFFTINGKRTFWGYTVVTLKFPESLQDANLNAMVLQGYSYVLSGVDTYTHEVRILSKSETPVKEGKCHKVTIEDTQWDLCVSPTNSHTYWLRKYFEFLLILGGSLGIGGLIYTLLELKKSSVELQKMALYDPLTGLPNRRFMYNFLEETLAISQERKNYTAIAYLDLDGFKRVNDNLGHSEGDRLLLATARRISQSVRSEDVVARIGGDEFIIIMKKVESQEQMEKNITRVLRNVNKNLFLKGEFIQISASIGVVMIDKDASHNIEYLLSEADKSMYKAKTSGKNRFYVQVI